MISQAPHNIARDVIFLSNRTKIVRKNLNLRDSKKFFVMLENHFIKFKKSCDFALVLRLTSSSWYERFRDPLVSEILILTPSDIDLYFKFIMRISLVRSGSKHSEGSTTFISEKFQPITEGSLIKGGKSNQSIITLEFIIEFTLTFTLEFNYYVI